MQLRILFFPLVLKVLLYDLFIGILPYGIHIISARPEPTAPEHLLDLRMKAENFPGRDALHCSDYFLRGVHRYTLYQKMDMVPVQANFQEMNLVTLLDLKTNLFESLRNGIAQHFSPIFDRTDKMVQKQAFVMTLVDMLTHNHKYKISIRDTRGRASGNSND